MSDNLRRSSRKNDAQNILLTQKCIICNKINKYKNKKLLPLVSCERKQKDISQCMAKESVYAATAVNDRIPRLCENYDFLPAELRNHKERRTVHETSHAE